MAELLSPSLAPFSTALAILLALLALELILLMLGGSLMAGDGPDVDLDADLDFDADIDAEFDAAPDSAGGLASLLGLGEVPVMIWIAAVLAGFGATGLVVQSLATGTLGAALPLWLAVPVAGAAALGMARGFSRLFARLLPRNYSESVSETELGRRRGVITVGTAARGKPAEVRVTDRHGNIQYLRAEPAQDGATLPQGTEVLVMRNPRTRRYTLIPLE